MHYNYFSAAYGTSTYNSSTYQDTAAASGGTSPTTTPVTTTTTAATGTTASQPGVLSNTGFELLGAATIASLIIFATLAIRFSRRKPAVN